MHQDSFYEAFRRKKQCLSVTYNGLDDVKNGFDVEVWRGDGWHKMPSQQEKLQEADDNIPQEENEEDIPNAKGDGEYIECLIVCCKSSVTEKAIKGVSHRLNSNSTILLVQNGLGVIEKLNETVFPDEKTRPHYMQGVFSHALTRRDSFQVSHMNVGSLILCPTVTDQTPLIDAEHDTHWAPTTKYLLRLLTLTPSLVAAADTPAGLLQYQLERLAVFSIISPLTALFNCKNGELLYNFSCTRIIRLLLFEISSVICALPELRGVPGIEDRFSPERLRRQLTTAASLSAKAGSAMLQDIKDQRLPDIDFLNGWIIKRGEEIGIKCVLNYMIKNMIHAKLAIIQRQNTSAVPFDFDNTLISGNSKGDKGEDA
ncbi:hypothetical protein N7462_001606 [Penicillium macrosclerotiorum]|uniref:uncharacterized protein n=1 Tax=Penicillium macrosclerotiorum TaxID=303699 RepID=UPI0025479092|nr:uncharacterized protein N7462_001606 [Penicillium macrosclerotiorum]KAJ5692183.1 hypothetical protein N7462_001606 [Penicillium macrosclerotiorum]